jgi:hypothetical protein
VGASDNQDQGERCAQQISTGLAWAHQKIKIRKKDAPSRAVSACAGASDNQDQEERCAQQISTG